MKNVVVGIVLVLVAAFGCAAPCEAGPAGTLYEDARTGQLFTRPGEGRVPVDPVEDLALPEAAPGSLYEDDATGALYARPGAGRSPVAPARPAREAAGKAGGTAAPGCSPKSSAQAARHAPGEEAAKTFPGIKLGAEAYVGYLYDFDKEKPNKDGSRGGRNEFTLGRGYINVKADLTPEMKFRLTPDITRKADGDFELRLKYLYAGFHGFIKAYPSLTVKVGQFEGAWLDHIEHLWTYRVQGTMLVEREGFMNSANLGVDFQGKLPGGYGEWQANLVNGEGYHAAENNKYKAYQARLTLHPLPGSELTRGLEFDGFVFSGKEDRLHKRDRAIAFVGYKYKDRLFVGGEYLWTHGNDRYVAPAGVNNVSGRGLSALGWYRMPCMEPLRLMCRFDRFDHDTGSPDNTVARYIYGLSYDINRHSTILLDGERVVARGYRGGYNKSYVHDENLLKLDVLIKF